MSYKVEIAYQDCSETDPNEYATYGDAELAVNEMKKGSNTSALYLIYSVEEPKDITSRIIAQLKQVSLCIDCITKTLSLISDAQDALFKRVKALEDLANSQNLEELHD